MKLKLTRHKAGCYTVTHEDRAYTIQYRKETGWRVFHGGRASCRLYTLTAAISYITDTQRREIDELEETTIEEQGFTIDEK